MTERETKRPGVPADPSGIDEPHDVLAADEFTIGTRDERLPPDPTGIHEPHDVLAAEEFAMPAAAGPAGEDPRGGPEPRTLVPLMLLVAILAFLLVRRRG